MRFKAKYQPEECTKRKNDQLNALNRRVEVFMDLTNNPRFVDLSVDCEKSEELLKLLDAVVIKLEGGNDSDLKVLDEPLLDDGNFKITKPVIASQTPKKKDSERKESWDNWEPTEGSDTGVVTKQSSTISEKEKVDTEEEGLEGKSEDNEENWSVSGKGDDDDSVRPGSATSFNTSEAKVTEERNGTEPLDKTDEKPEKELEELSEKNDNVEEQNEGDRDHEDKKSEQNSPPRPLHRTCSIFLRNLPPTITKQEVESICKRFSGFLRVAIADPQPERRFFRRGWVTFERGVNIKEICWNLNNIRLRDCELGAIVNRDLTRRIRPCNGIAAHRQVARTDIKLAAKIIQNLDKKHGLWTEETTDDGGEKTGFDLISQNPLLKNITDYLIEEADAEEEELLGKSTSEEKKEGEPGNEMTIERDETLLKMIDRLLFYLRIVHSVDYYNHSDYPNEDEMPNRCGIMHSRGVAPSIKVTQAEINDYITSFEQKMAVFLSPNAKLSDDEAVKLGKKDPKAEVEKFIAANIQEIGKDKWLCPLSGKKFKGPEFVKKHIFNKHGEKVEEVKKEVDYFNNYLMDPKRPQLPDHPINRPHRGGPGGGSAEGMREGYSGPSYGGGQGYPPPPHYPYGYGHGGRMPGPYGSGYGRGHYQGDSYNSGVPPGGPGAGGGFYGVKRGSVGRSRGDTREIIGYHDLDAPDDVDIF
ncbi:Serrate RNA effector molecule [Chamberlinius hualienensis]